MTLNQDFPMQDSCESEKLLMFYFYDYEYYHFYYC